MHSQDTAQRLINAQVVSANDLIMGDVVYRTSTGHWTRQLGEANLEVTKEDAASALAHAETQVDQIVGPYLIDVAVENDVASTPVHYREQIRLNGPGSSIDQSE